MGKILAAVGHSPNLYTQGLCGTTLRPQLSYFTPSVDIERAWHTPSVQVNVWTLST